MPDFSGNGIVSEVMRFTVLGSGSGGNAAVVECGEMRLMIDAGLSAKQLSLRLKHVGIEPASLNGILLTHEHGDHVKGLKVFLKQHPTPVFTTPATARVVREAGIEGGAWKFFEAGQTFAVGEIAIETFAIQHDAVDPVGFVVGHDSRRLGFLSDAGFVTRSMTERLRKLDGIFVEANYDEELLGNDTKRPWSIKQRISSRHGHLSNDQVTDLIKDISHPNLQRVVLGHLSSDCNTPETILSKLRRCLGELNHHHVELHCAGQDEPSSWFYF
ncbi:MAG: MBL fold metallo-hydrolase [Akkermansiaceae bacterium]|nr:MBL fold metallo-hydrolase [Akkermansiaceae bacterium]